MYLFSQNSQSIIESDITGGTEKGYLAKLAFWKIQRFLVEKASMMMI